MTDAPKWPAYPAGPHDSTYALGVVSINFANFERTQIWMLAAVGAMPEEAARMVHARVGATTCMELTKQIIAKRINWPGEPIDRVNHFIAASRILITNRNLLMHSVMTEGWQGNAALYRTSRKGEPQMLSASLEQIRSVPDDLVAYFNFGWMLANRIAVVFLNASLQVGDAVVHAWPDKPPLPVLLG
jgi:hypothetical protein